MGANDQETPTIEMTKICAWCNKNLATNEIMKADVIRELCENHTISHGICHPCKDELQSDFAVSTEEINNVLEHVSED